MKLYLIEVNEAKKLAVENKNHSLYILEDIGYKCDDISDFIDRYKDKDLIRLENIVSDDTVKHTEYSFDDVKVLSPVSKLKQDIICLGVNYFDHAKEVNAAENASDTIYFSKRANYVVGDGECIQSHNDIVSQLDYESELAVIIKKDAYKVSADDALNYIFGYSVINDVSARDLQSKHKQWYLGKSLDGFTAIGPCIVTADEIENPQNLNISCRVNGEIRQDSNTRLMIKSISSAIEELSAGMTLETGTIIATGTPGGVGKGMNPPQYLKCGDVVSCSIENIGVLTNIIN